MKMITKILNKVWQAILLAILPLAEIAAQTDTDFMRSMGKIYVVVAVIAVIFLGIFIFLVYLDRKLTKLENQIKNHE
jgi:CcmD family protein